LQVDEQDSGGEHQQERKGEFEVKVRHSASLEQTEPI
jgi:hypothetical protein